MAVNEPLPNTGVTLPLVSMGGKQFSFYLYVDRYHTECGAQRGTTGR